MVLFKKNPISELFENQLKEGRKSLIRGSMPIISRANTIFNINDDRFILIAQDLIKNNPYLYFRQSGDKLFKSHLIVQIVDSIAYDYSLVDQYRVIHHLFSLYVGRMPDNLIHFPREISLNLVKELLYYGQKLGYDINKDNSIPPISLLDEEEDLMDELARFWAGIWYGKTNETPDMYFGMVVNILSLFFYSTQEVARLFKNYLLEEKEGESKLNSYAQSIIDYDAELNRNIYILNYPAE